jgi:Mg-chelatase subunit ChlD
MHLRVGAMMWLPTRPTRIQKDLANTMPEESSSRRRKKRAPRKRGRRIMNVTRSSERGQNFVWDEKMGPALPYLAGPRQTNPSGLREVRT